MVEPHAVVVIKKEAVPVLEEGEGDKAAEQARMRRSERSSG